MGLTLEQLDGKYMVHSETSTGDPFVVNGDGETEIKNGLTYRKDKNGFIWESSFSIISQTEVQMESTIDPTHAASEHFIKDDKGNPTKSMVTYRATLDAAVVDGKLTLKGAVAHGDETTRLTMTKIS